MLRVVVVQEHPSTKVNAERPFPGCHDEGGIPSQTPLRPDLGPVPTPGVHRLLDSLWSVLNDPKVQAPLFPRQTRGLIKPLGELNHMIPVRAWQFIHIEHRYVIRRGVMHRCDEIGVYWDADTVLHQGGADVRLIEDSGGYPSVDMPRVSTTGTTVQAGTVGIVSGVGAMPTEKDHLGKALSDAHVLQSS